MRLAFSRTYWHFERMWSVKIFFRAPIDQQCLGQDTSALSIYQQTGLQIAPGVSNVDTGGELGLVQETTDYIAIAAAPMNKYSGFVAFQFQGTRIRHQCQHLCRQPQSSLSSVE
jgi:hypothetical protein